MNCSSFKRYGPQRFLVLKCSKLVFAIIGHSSRNANVSGSQFLFIERSNRFDATKTKIHFIRTTTTKKKRICASGLFESPLDYASSIVASDTVFDVFVDDVEFVIVVVAAAAADDDASPGCSSIGAALMYSTLLQRIKTSPKYPAN
jgi:hypothetical protein